MPVSSFRSPGTSPLTPFKGGAGKGISRYAVAVGLASTACAILLAGCQTATVTGPELLDIFHDRDRQLVSGFSAGGTAATALDPAPEQSVPSPIPVRMKWRLTWTDTALAYVRELMDEPVFDYDTLATWESWQPMDAKEILVPRTSWYIETNADSGSAVAFSQGTVYPGDQTVAGKSHLLRMELRPPRAYSEEIRTILHCLGRGFSLDIKTILRVTSAGGGMLRVTGEDLDGLTWELVVDPDTDYLVREARFYPDGPGAPPLYEMRNAGVHWYGNWCVAAEAAWTDFRSARETPATSNIGGFAARTARSEPFTSKYRVEISGLTPDDTLIQDCLRHFTPPVKGLVVELTDRRHQPPRETTYGP